MGHVYVLEQSEYELHELHWDKIAVSNGLGVFTWLFWFDSNLVLLKLKDVSISWLLWGGLCIGIFWKWIAVGWNSSQLEGWGVLTWFFSLELVKL